MTDRPCHWCGDAATLAAVIDTQINLRHLGMQKDGGLRFLPVRQVVDERRDLYRDCCICCSLLVLQHYTDTWTLLPRCA